MKRLGVIFLSLFLLVSCDLPEYEEVLEEEKVYKIKDYEYIQKTKESELSGMVIILESKEDKKYFGLTVDNWLYDNIGLEPGEEISLEVRGIKREELTLLETSDLMIVKWEDKELKMKELTKFTKEK